jgi:hypothetical protein
LTAGTKEGWVANPTSARGFAWATVHETGQHFSGTVNGQAVTVYDYEHSQHFNYTE